MAMLLLSMQRSSSLTTAAAAATLSLSLSSRPTGLKLQSQSQLAGAVIRGQRYASVRAQASYKQKAKGSIPKKLGVKRTGDQYVIPGNIIYKQRGTKWWPGENCNMGRDHTIHATVTGYVKYYRDPARHPDRKYIGVVFDKKDKLPYPAHAERKRRLNMSAHPARKPSPAVAPAVAPAAAPAAEQTGEKKRGRKKKEKGDVKVPPELLSPSGIPFQVTRVQPGEPDRILRLRDDYSYREDNWRIGQLGQTTGLKLKRFRTRKQYFRNRRWRRERELAGERKAVEIRAKLDQNGGGEFGMKNGKMIKAVSIKKAKKEKKEKKASKRKKLKRA